MSSLGKLLSALFSHLEGVRASTPTEKIAGAQEIIRASRTQSALDIGSRRFGVMCLAEAVVAKDRKETGRAA